MMMTPGQLGAFRARMMKAAAKGRAVARADQYMLMLHDMGASAKPGKGVVKGSAAHLMAMADEVLAGAKPRKKAAPRPAVPPPPPPAPAPVPEDEDDEKPYEKWLKAELVDEAEARGLETKDKLKDDLVDMLYADDEDGDEPEGD